MVYISTICSTIEDRRSTYIRTYNRTAGEYSQYSAADMHMRQRGRIICFIPDMPYSIDQEHEDLFIMV